MLDGILKTVFTLSVSFALVGLGCYFGGEAAAAFQRAESEAAAQRRKQGKDKNKT